MKKTLHILLLTLMFISLISCEIGPAFYTVSFNTDGAIKEIDSQSVKSGSKVIEPRDPDKEKSMFKAWTYKGSTYDFDSPVTENMTLLATYFPLHIVTFDTDGGTFIAPYELIEGKKVEKPEDPVKVGTSGFSMWVLVKADGSTVKYDFDTPVTEDITLKAVYTDETYCTVTFDSDGGTSISTQVIQSGISAFEPKDPEKDGAYFKAWYKVLDSGELDTTPYNFNIPVTSSFTLKAVYTPYYKVTFNSNGGSYTPSEQLIKENGTAIEPKAPEKAYSKGFMWWTKDGKVYDFSSPVTSSFTLTAQYWPDATNAESSDDNVILIKKEVRGIHGVLKNLVNNDNAKDLMKGSTDTTNMFKSDDVIRYIFTCARMDEGYITFNGNRYSIDDVDSDVKEKSIKSNNSKTESSDIGITKYTIDIEGLSFKMYFYSGRDNPSANLTTTMNIKGTVIQYNTDRYEMHIILTVNNDNGEKVYDMMHAAGIHSVYKSGGREETDDVLAFSYRGYTGYIPNVSLW